MYDTLGFPLDLTQIMATEKGFTIDVQGFQTAMENQKARGRQALKDKRLSGREALTLGAEQTAYLQKSQVKITDDASKYQLDIALPSSIKAIYLEDGFVEKVDANTETIGLVLESTSFYAESGGQVPDKGFISVTLDDGSTLDLEVIDVQVREIFEIYRKFLPSMIANFFLFCFNRFTEDMCSIHVSLLMDLLTLTV
jgi:alanyl-tRNA synthetase